MSGFPEKPLQEMQKQEQTPQVVVKGGGENPEEASKNSGSDWLISIQGKLKQAEEDDAAGSCSNLCIYKVPHSIRNADYKAFVPLNVSLGPYHNDKKCPRQMDRHKWRFLRRVLERTKQDIKVYLESVREVEERARSCYEGPITLNSNEFVEMMVLDGCFVLELFRGVDEEFVKLGYPRDDPVFARLGSMHSIKRDMIMLENQLPLFILERLLKLQLGCQYSQKDVAKLAVKFFQALIPIHPTSLAKKASETPSDAGLHCLEIFRRSLLSGSKLAKLTVKFFQALMPTHPTSLAKKASETPSDAGLHCLEIFRRSLLGGSKPDPLYYVNRYAADKRRNEGIYCATELKDSGIKFMEREADQFWDIKFENGVLSIPRLLIDDGTKSLFLNLMAFEECHFGCGHYITSYVLFMDNLINSPMDFAHLHSCGIIEHWLGSDNEVADLFNRLCYGVVLHTAPNYLSQLSAEVNKYHNRRWNTWKATLRHKYLNSPWAIISVIAAVVLLLLTFMQTFYGVYAYYRPSS